MAKTESSRGKTGPRPFRRIPPSRPTPSPRTKPAARKRKPSTTPDSRRFERGDLTSAKLAFQKALTASPGNVPALLNLALVEQRLRTTAKRRGTCGRSCGTIRKTPRPGSSSASRRTIRTSSKPAHAHLAQAVLYAPKNAQAHQFLGVVLGRKGWYSAGEEELRRAWKLDPKLPTPSHLAVLYMERVPRRSNIARRHYEALPRTWGAADAELARKLDAEAPRNPRRP
jgi:tetratricopeptide (TPR) repeat protein